MIFSSYPTRVLETKALTGPDPKTWYFVAQDPSDTWLEYDVGTMAGYVKTDFADVPEKYRSRTREQAFRFIQLADIVNVTQPPALGPVLRSRFEADGNEYPIQILAPVISQDAKTGQFANSVSPVEVSAAWLREGNIIQLERALGQLTTSPTGDPNANFRALKKGELTVRFSFEQGIYDAKADRWAPKYFHVGFDQTGAQMADGDVENAIDGAQKDALIIPREDLRLLVIDGQVANQSRLIATVKTAAKGFLKDVNSPTRVVTGRGFCATECSGLVSEIRWDQHALTTTLKLNDWFAPGGALEGHGDQHRARRFWFPFGPEHELQPDLW